MRMPFQERLDRASKWQKSHSQRRDEGCIGDMMEKGDGLAMLLAALITIVPVCLAVLAVMAAVGYFFIAR